MHERTQTTLPRKRFDSPTDYADSIRKLVPGYDLLHELVPPVLASNLFGPARILVVGCGPGDELVRIAGAHPEWTIDAVDPSPEMVAAAETKIIAADLGARVWVSHGDLKAHRHSGYDAVVALLVTHLIDDDGARQDFMTQLGAKLRPSGIAILSEFVIDRRQHAVTLPIHLQWAFSRGLTADRIDALRHRLTTEFALVAPFRLAELARSASLQLEAEFFRSLMLEGHLYRKR